MKGANHNLLPPMIIWPFAPFIWGNGFLKQVKDDLIWVTTVMSWIMYFLLTNCPYLILPNRGHIRCDRVNASNSFPQTQPPPRTDCLVDPMKTTGGEMGYGAPSPWAELHDVRALTTQRLSCDGLHLNMTSETEDGNALRKGLSRSKYTLYGPFP